MNRRQWLKKTLCSALALPFLRGKVEAEEGKIIELTLPDYKAEIEFCGKTYDSMEELKPVFDALKRRGFRIAID